MPFKLYLYIFILIAASIYLYSGLLIETNKVYLISVPSVLCRIIITLYKEIQVCKHRMDATAGYLTNIY